MRVIAAGVLHVSAVQAHNCLQLQACQDLKCLEAPAVAFAPAVAHSGLLEVLQAATGPESATFELAKTALCLATPEESFPDEQQARSMDRGTIRSPGENSGSVSTRVQTSSSSFQSNSSSRVALRAPMLQETVAEVGTRAAVLQEELAQMALLEYAEWLVAEGVGCQDTLRLLQSAAAVRKQRRRALVRVLGTAWRAARQAGIDMAERMARAHMVEIRV